MRYAFIFVALILAACGDKREVMGMCRADKGTFLYKTVDGLLASFRGECNDVTFRYIAPSAVKEICPDFKGELK